MLVQLSDGLREMGIEVQPSQVDMFELYREELVRWNQRMNLTSITTPEEIETRHFLDSLTVLYALPEHTKPGSGLSIIDIGSGAGFPGIPLKLALPDVRLTLLEATGKKVAFLRHIVNVLELSDTDVVHGRAEELAHRTGYREAFDVCVARAVAPLPTLAELCLPFVRVGGHFIALKKGDIKNELERSRVALSQLGAEEVHVIDIPLRQLPDDRHVVCVAKASASPDTYPRRTGIPAKRPL